MALLGIQLEKPTIGNAQRSKAKRTRFVIRERAERLKLGRGSSRFPCMKVTLGNVKKTGRETFCLLPAFEKRFTIALVLVEQLHSHGRLVSVGLTTSSLKDPSIGPVLPNFRSPQEIFGELVGSRQSHFAQGNV